MHKKKILIFENNEALADAIMLTLVNAGYEEGNITVAVRPSQFPDDTAKWKELDLAIVDLMMGDEELPKAWQEETDNGNVTGAVVYTKLCQNRNVPVIILSALRDSEKRKRGEDLIRDFTTNYKTLTKPVESGTFLSEVQGILK